MRLQLNRKFCRNLQRNIFQRKNIMVANSIWMIIHFILLSSTLVSKYTITVHSIQTFEFLMNDPQKAIEMFYKESSLENFHIYQLFNQIITLSLFYITIGFIGLFAYFQYRSFELLHQFCSIISITITIILINNILTEQFYLQRRFVTSIGYAIIGHNSRSSHVSYWLQMIQHLLNCCGFNRPEKHFFWKQIPITCCKTLDQEKIKSWNANRLSFCSMSSSNLDYIKSKLKLPCNQSYYYVLLPYLFTTYLIINFLLQFIIVHLVFRIYCRKYLY